MGGAALLAASLFSTFRFSGIGMDLKSEIRPVIPGFEFQCQFHLFTPDRLRHRRSRRRLSMNGLPVRYIIHE